jgi:hypothetical protein
MPKPIGVSSGVATVHLTWESCWWVQRIYRLVWNGEERAAMQAVCRPCTKQVAVALSPNAGTRGSEAQRGRKPPIGCLVEGKAGTQALCMLNDMHGHAHGFCVLSIYSDASFSSSLALGIINRRPKTEPN